MALSDLSKESVLKAIEEFDRLGRDAFLEKYGFGRARDHFIEYRGRYYDVKAIAGSAHGYLADKKPLSSNIHTHQAQPVLESLGFRISASVEGEELAPLPGHVFTNDEIARRFAVGNMGGMRRSLKLQHLVLISDPFKGLYQDRWEGDVLHYTGMGKVGDQSLESQNRTLFESQKTSVRLHLLEALEPYKYTYAGEVELAGAPYQEEQPDDEGRPRKVWMFPIRLKPSGVKPLLTEEQARTIEASQAKIAKKLSLDDLRRRAAKAKRKPAMRETQAPAYVRDAAVAEYAKRMAKGICDLCEMEAPFRNKQNDPYLECHHVSWLANGGEDTIENTVALCPNCHRKMHVLNLAEDQKALKRRALKREQLLTSAAAPLGAQSL